MSKCKVLKRSIEASWNRENFDIHIDTQPA